MLDMFHELKIYSAFFSFFYVLKRKLAAFSVGVKFSS